ncbi:hypothetical protein GOP47_0031198, partial [Adiantum capillus-veneris]
MAIKCFYNLYVRLIDKCCQCSAGVNNRPPCSCQCIQLQSGQRNIKKLPIDADAGEAKVVEVGEEGRVAVLQHWSVLQGWVGCARIASTKCEVAGDIDIVLAVGETIGKHVNIEL